MKLWEQVIVAKTCDGSGMQVILESCNHDNENREYRVVYGEENEKPENLFYFEGFQTLDGAFKCFTEYVEGEVMGYFGLESIHAVLD